MSESEAARLERLVGPIRDFEAAISDLSTIQTCWDEKSINIGGLEFFSFKLGNSMGAEGGLLYGNSHTAICWVRVCELPTLVLKPRTVAGRIGALFSGARAGRDHLLEGERPQGFESVVEVWREHPERTLECRDGIAALWARGGSNPASYAQHLSRLVALLN